MWLLFEIYNSVLVSKTVTRVVSSKRKSVPLQCLQTAKIVNKFLQKNWWNYFVATIGKIFRSNHRNCSVSKVFFKKLQSSQESIYAGLSFLDFVKLLRARFLQHSSGGCYWLFWIMSFLPNSNGTFLAKENYLDFLQI